MVAETGIRSYRDLRVWQEAMTLAEAVYRLTQTFPPSEQYGMISQMRRAAVSVPANIAEGYGRESRGDYIRFLQIAQGSLKELETHLLLSVRVELTTAEAADYCLRQCEPVSKMLRALIRSLQRKQ